MAFESSAEVTLKELQEVLAVFAVSEESPRDPGGTRGSEEEVGRHTRLNLETELGLSSSAFTAQCSKLLAQLIDIDGRRGLMNPEGDGSGSAGAGSRSSASSKSLSSQAEAESPVAASVRSLAWWEQNLRFSSPKLLDSSQSEHDLSVVWDFVCGQIALRRRSPGQDSRVSLDSNNSTSTSSGPVRSVSRVGTLMSSSSLVSGKKQERGSIHSEPEGSANPRVSGQVSEILRKPGAKRQGSGRSMGSSSGLSASDRPSGSSAKKNFPSDAEEEPVLARKDSRRSSGTPQSSGTSSGTPQSSVSSSGGSFVPASAPTGSLLDKAKTRKEADGEDAACGNRETMREVGPGVQRVDAAAPATSGTESTESTSKLTRGTESTTAGPERRSAPSCFALSGSFTLFGALALVPVLYGVGMYYLLHNSGCGLVFCAPNEQADTIELLKQFLEDDGDTLRVSRTAVEAMEEYKDIATATGLDTTCWCSKCCCCASEPTCIPPAWTYILRKCECNHGSTQRVRTVLFGIFQCQEVHRRRSSFECGVRVLSDPGHSGVHRGVVCFFVDFFVKFSSVYGVPNKRHRSIEIKCSHENQWLSEKVHHGILDYTEAAVPPTRSVEINPAASFKGSPEGGGRRRRPKFELPLLTTYWTHVSSFVAEHFSMLEAGTGLDFKTEVLDPCECCQSCQCLPLRLVYLRTGKRPVLDLSRGIRVFLEQAHDDDLLFKYYLTIDVPNAFISKCFIGMEVCACVHCCPRRCTENWCWNCHECGKHGKRCGCTKDCRGWYLCCAPHEAELSVRGAPMTFVLGIPAEGKLVELVHAVPAQFSKYAGGKVPGEPERIDMWDKTLPQDWWNWSPRKAEADPNPPRFRGGLRGNDTTSNSVEGKKQSNSFFSRARNFWSRKTSGAENRGSKSASTSGVSHKTAPGTSSSRAFLARSSNSTYQKSTPQKKERETGVARGSPANPDTNHLRGRAWVHDLFHNLPTGRTLQQTLREGLYDRANNPRGELFDDLSNKNTRVRIGNSFLFFDCCVTCVLTCHKMKDKAFCKPINAVQRKCMPIPLLTYVGAAIRLTIQRVLELPIEALPIFVADTWTREKLLEAHLDMRYTGSISEVLRGEDVKTFSIYDDGLGASAWKEKEPGPGVRLDLHITRWFWSSGVLKEISSKTEQHEKSEAGASGPGTP